jgi:hypothetical protein
MSFGGSPVRLDVGATAEQHAPNKGVSDMQYLLMIYTNEAEYAKRDAATVEKVMAEYGAFTQSIIQSGNFKAGDRLRPTSTATTVRVRDGKLLTTDGPFAETREQLAGFYLLECADLDEATRWAAKVPGAASGSVEVRPVMDYEATGRQEAKVEPEGARI